MIKNQLNATVSIILFCGNATQDSVNKTIDSLLNQTFKIEEIIIIIDSNHSLNIANTINAKVISSKLDRLNSFLDEIQSVKSDYVLFAEAGNEYCSDYIRKSLDVTLRKKADILVNDWVYKHEGESLFLPYESFRNNSFNLEKSSIIESYINQKGYDFTWDIFDNKIYSSVLLNQSLVDLMKLRDAQLLSNSSMHFVIYCHAAKLTNIHNRPVYIKKIIDSNSLDDKKIYDKELFSFYEKTLTSNSYAHLVNNLETWQNDLKTNKVSYLPLKWQNFGNEYQDFESIISSIKDETYKVISFDIFDTLIIRDCLIPTDVFDILGHQFEKELSTAFYLQFKKLRQSAESEARQYHEANELNIKDIYDYMVKNYDFPEDLAKTIMGKEIELEIDMASRRETGKDLYDIAWCYGKTIVYTSDMYLNPETIYAMLEKNGYSKKNHLYLSSIYKASKNDGQIFNVILKELGIKREELLHIGDNYVVDYQMVLEKNIKAHHIPNVNSLFIENDLSTIFRLNTSSQDPRAFDQFVGLRMMAGLVAHELYDFPFFHRLSEYNQSPKLVGYYLLGMHLYSYIDWLRAISKKDDKLFFVARDGYLPFKAFKHLENYFEDLPSSHYIYLSRKFLFPLSIYNEKDFLSAIEQIDFSIQSIDTILKLFPKKCLNTSEIKKIPQIKLKTNFISQDDYMRNIHLISKCINYNELSKYRDKVIDKFLSNINSNDFLIDSGYSGRNEAIISKLIKHGFNSVYFHPRADIALSNFNKGGCKLHSFYNYVPMVSYDIREICFADLDKSLVTYDYENDVLLFKTVKRNTTMTDIVNTIQNNALKFVDDFAKKYSKYDYSILYLKDSASLPWEIYLENSSDFDRDFFEGFFFENDMGNGDHKLLELWASMTERRKLTQVNKNQTQLIEQPPLATKHKTLKKCVSFFLPKGTKRREIVKKIYKKIRR